MKISILEGKKNPHLQLFDANADLIIVWKN